VAPQAPTRVANPIYREVIVRVLAAGAEQKIPEDQRSFVSSDGRRDRDGLFAEFSAFWREHGEILAGGMPYQEVAPQLVLMAYLQRVANSGDVIDREYGVGRGRIDLLVRWPYKLSSGQRAWQREAVEMKVWKEGRPDPRAEGLLQLEEYLEKLGLDHGFLVIFDRRQTSGETPSLPAAIEPQRTVKGLGAKVLVLR
jgi:hypothetical protein